MLLLLLLLKTGGPEDPPGVAGVTGVSGVPGVVPGWPELLRLPGPLSAGTSESGSTLDTRQRRRHFSQTPPEFEGVLVTQPDVVIVITCRWSIYFF